MICFILLGITKRDLEHLPIGIALPFREAIFHCRCNPPSDWPEEAYVLIGIVIIFDRQNIEGVKL